MMQRLFELIRRGWRKPPQVIARWLMRQAGAEWYQRSAPARDREGRDPVNGGHPFDQKRKARGRAVDGQPAARLDAELPG